MSISDTSGTASSRPASSSRHTSSRDTPAGGRFATAQGTPPVRGTEEHIIDPHQPEEPDEPDEPVQGERECQEWLFWDEWITMRDERVCPECGPLHGQWFRQGVGPHPPLHSGCRCRRRLVYRECAGRTLPSGTEGRE